MIVEKCSKCIQTHSSETNVKSRHAPLIFIRKKGGTFRDAINVVFGQHIAHSFILAFNYNNSKRITSFMKIFRLVTLNVCKAKAMVVHS